MLNIEQRELAITIDLCHNTIHTAPVSSEKTAIGSCGLRNIRGSHPLYRSMNLTGFLVFLIFTLFFAWIITSHLFFVPLVYVCPLFYCNVLSYLAIGTLGTRGERDPLSENASERSVTGWKEEAYLQRMSLIQQRRLAAETPEKREAGRSFFLVSWQSIVLTHWGSCGREFHLRQLTCLPWMHASAYHRQFYLKGCVPQTILSKRLAPQCLHFD